MIATLLEQVWSYAASGGWLLGLLGYFVKSSLILLTALAILSLLKRRPPAVRHLVIRSAFLAVLVLALLSPLLPSWQITWPGYFADGWKSTIAALQIDAAVDAAVTPAATHWSLWLLLLWLAGCLVAGSRLLFGLVSALRLARTGAPVRDQDLLRTVARISNQLGIRQPVRLLINERLTVPIVFGLVRATILLPSSVCEWTQEKRHLILRHELAHVKRRDTLWTHIATLTSIFHWFNPLVWAAKGKMAAESEFACDDSVLEIGVPSSDYAQHLLDCARQAGRLDRAVRAGIALAYNTHLEGRIMSILTNRKRATLTTSKLTAAVTAVMLALALPLVGLNWQAQAEETPAPKTPVKNEEAEALPGPDDFVAVDSFPEMTHQEAPIYPEKAKNAGTQGKVWVKSLVGKKGVVLDVQLAKTSGHKMLDEAALKAAWKCTFTPATVKGKTIAVWVTYVVEFVIDEKADSDK